MASITPTQYKFLKLLVRTGFATNKHLCQVGLTKEKTSNHYITDRLLANQYIGRLIIVPAFGFGRKVMYYVTKKGAELIAESENVELESLMYSRLKGGIQTAKGGQDLSVVRNDFVHRERYISTFLAFEKYLENTEYSLDRVYNYYQVANDKGTGLKLNGKNFRPDGIFFCETHDSTKPVFLYVVELHRHSDRRKIINQLKQHAHALEQQAIKQRFSVEYPYFVLSVFTDENTVIMRSVIEELKQTPEWPYFRDFFMFAPLEDMQADLYRAFAYFGNHKKPLPPAR